MNRKMSSRHPTIPAVPPMLPAVRPLKFNLAAKRASFWKESGKGALRSACGNAGLKAKMSMYPALAAGKEEERQARGVGNRLCRKWKKFPVKKS